MPKSGAKGLSLCCSLWCVLCPHCCRDMGGLEGPLGTTEVGAVTLANLSLHSLPTRSLLLSHDLHLGRERKDRSYLELPRILWKQPQRILGELDSIPDLFLGLLAPQLAEEPLRGGGNGLDKRMVGKQEDPCWLPLPTPLVHSAAWQRIV